MKFSVLIIQRRLPQYRTALFERLRERLLKSNIEVSLLHGGPPPAELLKKDEASLPWAEKVRSRYLRFGRSDFVFMSLPRNLIRKQDLIIMPHENGMIVNYLLLVRRLVGGKSRLAFFGHGKNFQYEDTGEMRGRLRRMLIPLVDWWFAYTELSAKEVRAAGFPDQKITCLNNAIDTAAQSDMAAGISSDEQKALFKDLGLTGRHSAIFLSSLYENKRLGFLFDAADELRQRIADFELLLIGDGPLHDEVEKFVKLRPWAKWVGAQFNRDKVLHASLGKVMLNPGLVGLNILDSFSLGIPMVTTDCRIHSPEIAYLENQKNGIMTEDSLTAFVDAAEGLLNDHVSLAAMRRQCLEDAGEYTLQSMVENFAGGIEAALGLRAEESASSELLSRSLVRPHTPPSPSSPPLTKVGALSEGGAILLPSPPVGEGVGEGAFLSDSLVTSKQLHIAVIWQRFLPYHKARLSRLQETLAAMGHQLTAIEVASQDKTYGFPEGEKTADQWITCFPGQVYHHYSAAAIHEKVLATLRQGSPDIVFAPATAFPEGMAALRYRMESGSKIIIMDDAWEMTDKRGMATRIVKKIVHSQADGAFIPAPSHMGYYAGLNIPKDRMVCGVNVVENDYYAAGTAAIRREGSEARSKLGIPQHYFLFVGRFLKKKGIETLLDAYEKYRTLYAENAWSLVLVGDGAELEAMKNRAEGLPNVHFAGRQMGDELLAFYAFAEAVVVPSERDPWALVVNEAMAAGLPIIVSSGVGSARTLVREGANGWSFAPGDSAALAKLMEQVTLRSPEELKAMGEQSRKIIAEWSLDRFCQGVLEALKIPRRDKAGHLSEIAVLLWKGRVSVN